MEEKLIERLLNSHNVWESAIVVLGAALLAFFRKRLYFFLINLKGRISFKLEFEDEKTKILGLKSHDIFRTIERVRTVTSTHKFHHSDGIDETKTHMFKDFMNFKLDAISIEFSKLISKAAYAEDMEDVKGLCFDAVTIATKQYLNETKIHFLESGISNKDANYVIDLFERWRLETITSVQNRINSVFSSKYHNTKYDNLLAVLELISMAIDLIPKDGIGAFNSFNGKFKNIKYKNNEIN
jgi:hypothetical protein